MKKSVFLMPTLFLIAFFCFAQENGIVTYTITSDWVKMYASCDYLSKADRERNTYTWGGESNWERKAELKFNVDENRFEEKPSETQRWRRDDYIIYRDREKNETFDVMTLLSKDYVIKDAIVCQNWKIKNDMKEIAGRICMNASCFDSIKGKEIVAWFALDLPIPIGPDRYCGLPGMILEVIEANGAVVYTATSIIFSEEKIEIEKPVVKKKRKIIDSQEHNSIIGKYIADCRKMQRPYFWSGIAF